MPDRLLAYRTGVSYSRKAHHIQKDNMKSSRRPSNNCYDSPDKILAYAGMSPSIYQSGHLSLSGVYSHMERRGSRHLRYALYNATKYVCLWDSGFAAYLAKKRAEGKHYNVALSHATKKLVRLICAMEKSRQSYNRVA